jgi:FAD/FMN-containing dehydrogenase
MAKHSNFLRDLSESYLADLGRITAGWSQIELLFDVLFLSLVVFWGRSTGSTKEPQVTKLMGMRFCDRLRALRDRINEMDLPPETQKAAEKVLSQLNTLRNERDRVAHSVWSPQITEEFAINPEAAIALYKSWKNQKAHEHSVVPQERLREIFRRIEALYWGLFDLSLDLRSLPQVPRPVSH